MKRFTLLFVLCLSFVSQVFSQYKIMVSTDYPPYNFMDDDRNLVGFNAEILLAIQNMYKDKITVIPGDWAEINVKLNDGTIDAIAGAHFPGNPDEEYRYTRSVIQTSHSFIYNRQFHRNFSIDELRTIHEPVIVLWNNDVLKRYVFTINPNAKYIFVNSYSELISKLDDEKVTCGLAERNAALYYANLLGNTNIMAGNEAILERPLGFKVSKNAPELTEMLDNGLEVLLANGEYQTIYDKWISSYEKNNYLQPLLKYMILLAIIISAIILFLLTFNHILQLRVRKRTKDLQLQLTLNTKITKELEEQKIKAEESDRMKSAFLANMSHEIRTPMNGILGFTDLLKSEQYSKEERSHFVDIIQQSGERMLTTINNIIEISKIESGVETLHLGEINFNLIIKELFQFFVVEAQKKGLELHLEEIGNELNTTFISDVHKVNSILTNLIKNAIKFTLNGSVKISYHFTNEKAEFSISDTGIGIPLDKQKAIFDYFVQADSSHSSRFEGSGLGLSISKNYVHMLQGNIHIESEPEIGSTFYVTLPNLIDIFVGEKDEKIINGSEIYPTPQNLKILIAEDDKASLFILKYIVKDIAKEILHAQNGLEAIDMARKNADLDLILMDSKMPELEGLEAVKEIRTFNPKILIISQTAHVYENYRSIALAAGCNDYIEKPVKKAKLMEMISIGLSNKYQKG